jgi:RNA polymerase sigma factor (sigma-70 family)
MSKTANQNSSQNCDYSAIINKYKDLAFNIALKITKNEQDSEEIVQDSFVKAFKGLDNFKNESQFSTWFYRIVYNTAISSIRHKKHIAIEIDDKLTATLENNQIEDAIKNLDEYDRKLLINEALAKLNAIDYTILSLYYYENLSLKEISKIVEKKKSYLKVLLQRARLKLYNGLSISLKRELKELI